MTTIQLPGEAADEFGRWIARTGFAPTTKKLYPAQVRAFTTWLTERGEEYHDALADPHGRDYAVRDYREHLLTVDKKAPATVEVALSAIGAFYDHLGLGKPERIIRQNPNRDDVRSLEPAEAKRVLRAAERRGNRDFALTMLLYGTGVRVAEASALDTDDLFISDRKGVLEVRHGKGGASRQLPVEPDVRAAVRPWLNERAEKYGRTVGPLFVSRKGGRLSARRIQSLMADMGESVGVELSPHTLRHTFAREYLDDGGDLASLQRLLGHRNLSSTQVYTRPSNTRLAEFMENRRRISL